MGRNKVFASCTRSTAGVLQFLQPLSSLLVSVAVCLVGLVACLDLVHGSHHHHSRKARVEPSDRLCSFTPKEEREYAAASYESARPDSGDDLQDFLREWRRDVREEETVRFQPIKMVCSSALQILSRRACVDSKTHDTVHRICFFMHCARVFIIDSSMYYYCHCGQMICLGSWVSHFQIGSGNQGSVVEAKDLATKTMVAIKQVQQSDLRSIDQYFPQHAPVCTLAAAANAQAEAQASRVLHPFRNHQKPVCCDNAMQCTGETSFCKWKTRSEWAPGTAGARPAANYEQLR